MVYDGKPIQLPSHSATDATGIPAVQLGGCMKCANREMRCPDPTLMIWTTGSSDLGNMAMSWLFQWEKNVRTIEKLYIYGRMIQNEKDRWILWYLWYPGMFMRQWPYLVRSASKQRMRKWLHQ